jgi:hypothetical protein
MLNQRTACCLLGILQKEDPLPTTSTKEGKNCKKKNYAKFMRAKERSRVFSEDESNRYKQKRIRG